MDALVDHARRRNQAEGVTGALVASASGFAQVLEGSRDAVERTFQRISRDGRHSHVSLLSFTPAPRRMFPHAPLVFFGDFRPDERDPLAGFLADVGGEERALTGGDLLRLVARLVRAVDDAGDPRQLIRSQ